MSNEDVKKQKQAQEQQLEPKKPEELTRERMRDVVGGVSGPRLAPAISNDLLSIIEDL